MKSFLTLLNEAVPPPPPMGGGGPLGGGLGKGPLGGGLGGGLGLGGGMPPPPPPMGGGLGGGLGGLGGGMGGMGGEGGGQQPVPVKKVNVMDVWDMLKNAINEMGKYDELSVHYERKPRENLKIKHEKKSSLIK